VSTVGLPPDIAALARRGPRAGDQSGFGGNPVAWAEAREGAMGWYNRCLNFVNQAWNYTVGRFRLATARESMNAGPRSMSGVPPAGAGVYWDTGPYGHIALAAGNGTVYSNDIRAAGRIDQVPQNEVNKWGPYRGWWHPGGAAPGSGSLGMVGGAVDNVLGFLGKLSPVEWLKKKAGEVASKFAGGGGAFGSGLASSIPKLIIDRAKEWIGSKVGGLAGAAGASWEGAGVGSWSKDQLNNAATIISVARQLGFGDKGAMIGLITAMQESTLKNLSYGHLDSVGLFQQRNAWGSFADRTNPAKSASMFYNGGQGGQEGLRDKAWRTLSPGAAAQAVQVSSFPGLYSPHIPKALAILDRFKTYDSGGLLPRGLSLAYNGTGSSETVRTSQQEADLARGTTINHYTIRVDGALNDDYSIGKLITAIERYERRRVGVKQTLRTA
jgi:hypothetical protein